MPKPPRLCQGAAVKRKAMLPSKQTDKTSENFEGAYHAFTATSTLFSAYFAKKPFL
jgi:hypothetical protein